MKKIFALILAVIMCVSLFSACGEKIRTADDKALNESVVAKIGDIEVTQAYYNFIYSLVYQNMAQYEQYYGPDWINLEIEEGKKVKDYIEESAKIQIEQLAASTIIAKENGIKMDKEAQKTLEDQKKQVIESYESKEDYIAFLEEARTTDEAISDYLETYLILELLFEKITKEGEKGHIPESEIEEQFLKEYKDKLRVQHVLISTMDDESTGEKGKSEEEALKIANEVIEKLDKGEKMDTLITEYGEDPGMTAGQFYVFGAGEMVAEFEEASKNLKVGQYTKEPVKSDYGYHVIKRYAIDKETEEFESYSISKHQEKLTQIIEEEIKNIKIKWDNEKIEKYVEKWHEDLAKEKEEAASQQEEAAPEESAEETPAE